MLFLVRLTLSMSDLEENCAIERINPTYFCLECPASNITFFSPRPLKGQLLFIFEASDTFADLEYGLRARDLFSSGHGAIIAEKKKKARNVIHRLSTEIRG